MSNESISKQFFLTASFPPDFTYITDARQVSTDTCNETRTQQGLNSCTKQQINHLSKRKTGYVSNLNIKNLSRNGKPWKKVRSYFHNKGQNSGKFLLIKR